MVDLDQLERRATRTAEWGRARMAVRASVVVVLVGGAALVAGGEWWIVSALGCVLLIASAGLRFWHREGVDAVRIGLTVGLVPLAAALLIRACNVECDPFARVGEGEIVCILAGVAAGIGVTLHPTSRAAPLRVWVLAIVVASLTGALGCVSLGIGGALATVLALLVGSAATVPLRAPLAV